MDRPELRLGQPPSRHDRLVGDDDHPVPHAVQGPDAFGGAGSRRSCATSRRRSTSRLTVPSRSRKTARGRRGSSHYPPEERRAS
jgi:hypothetical protein